MDSDFEEEIRMNYLVIGDANSMHIFNFVKTILLPQNYKVHLVTLSTRPIRLEYMDFYHANSVTVHSVAEKGYQDLNKTDRLHRIKHLLRKFRLMNEVPYVDICHIHSVYKTSLLMLLLNKKKFGRIILSYWGGDIEDKTNSVIKLRAKCFEIADAITVTVQETYREFQRIYGHKFDEKLSICRFATDGLNCIHELSMSMSRHECRETYGIPSDRVCITCGYSAYAEQHQDKCLEIIQKLDEKIRKKIMVIVPMQYGRFDLNYIAKVKKIAESSDFPCRVLEEFVPFEKSAQLAIATDIYLHVRDTDAFSNALKEHVYAGSLVIKGDWLKYPELDEMGAKVHSLSTLGELGACLTDLLSGFEISEEICLFEPIYELYSTEAIKKQWSCVIDRCLKA